MAKSQPEQELPAIGDWIEYSSMKACGRVVGVVRAIGDGEVIVDSRGLMEPVPIGSIREVRSPEKKAAKKP